MPFNGDITVATDVSSIVGTQLGIVGPPVTTTDSGPITSGSTEALDTSMPLFRFTVATAQTFWGYRINLAGRGVNATTIGDRFSITFRDGFGATPNSSSPQCDPNFNVAVPAVGSAGVQAKYYASHFKPGLGAHTIGVFLVRDIGTGTGFLTGAAELYVEATFI